MLPLLYKILRAGYWLAFLWVVLIFILLVMPARDIPSPSILNNIHFDKFVHFSLFGILVALWTIPYADRRSQLRNTRFFVLVCLASCAYGAGMEWVQLKFTTDRDYENLDIVADSLGAIVGMVLSMLWVRHEKRKRLALGAKGKPL